MRAERSWPIGRRAVRILCLSTLFATASLRQSVKCEPVHAAAESVLTFHFETRLRANSSNQINFLPKGTAIFVNVSDSIGSTVEHDGTESRGHVVSPVVLGNQVLLHAESEVEVCWYCSSAKHIQRDSVLNHWLEACETMANLMV